jgi:aminopeptidase
MRDSRLVQLSNSLVNYSVEIKKDEIVRIVAVGFETKPLVKELVKAVYDAGGHPFVEWRDQEVSRLVSEQVTEVGAKQGAKWELERTKDMNAVIYVRGLNNDFEGSTVPADVHKLLGIEYKEAMRIRVNERKWVLLNYPTFAYAQKAKMPLDAFEDFALEVMTVDYSKMKKSAKALEDLMNKTDKVRIVGPNTDLSFSIKDIPAIICAGEMNIPDGEVYTAPVKDSVNGTITYNTPAPYRGKVYNNVSLTFENGKIVNATADNDVDSLQEIFETDEGARYVGEFAIGINPKILHPMGDILFDEKIAGSIHFTPGQAYDDAYNGNDSSVHWDIVLIQRDEYGGGEIYFDDELVRRDGLFVKEELLGLNPENLV